MRRLLCALCAVLWLLPATGCKADDREFHDAVARYVDGQPAVCLAYGTWPFKSPLGSYVPLSRQQAQVLSSLGLLKIGSRPFETEGSHTPKGQEIYFPYSRNPSRIARDAYGRTAATGALCVGTRSLSHIVEYTEPASTFGMTLTRVEYAYRLEGIPSWATTSQITNAFPKAKPFLLSTIAYSSMELVKTNKGWRLAK